MGPMPKDGGCACGLQGARKAGFSCTSVLVFALLFAYVASATTEPNGLKERRIWLVLWFDDYSSLSSTALEESLIAILKRHQVPCTFSVIPFVCAVDVHLTSPQHLVPLSDEKASILRNAVASGTVDVALHGYSHQTNREREWREFEGLSADEQLERLAKGKIFLENLLQIEIVSFVPPWNRYDSATLRSLEKLGFELVSSDIRGPSNLGKLKFLPATCGIHLLQKAVEEARGTVDPQPLIVLLFHAGDFLEKDPEMGKITLEQFDALLRWVAAQDDIRVATIIETIDAIDDLGTHRYRQNVRLGRLLELLPSFLRPPIKHVYLSSTTAERMLCLLAPRLLAFYCGILIVSGIAGFFLAPAVTEKSRIMRTTATWGGPMVTVLATLYVFCNLSVSYRGAGLICALAGVSVGLRAGTCRWGKRTLASPIGAGVSARQPPDGL